jgi:hypothetical protein
VAFSQCHRHGSVFYGTCPDTLDTLPAADRFC